MKKFYAMTLLVASVFAIGLVTPLSAGVLDFIMGADNSKIEKSGTLVSWRMENPTTHNILTKDNVRISDSVRNNNKKSILTKDNVLISDSVRNNNKKSILTKDNVIVEK